MFFIYLPWSQNDVQDPKAQKFVQKNAKRICTTYSRLPKSERSDFGARNFGSVVKPFGFQTVSENRTKMFGLLTFKSSERTKWFGFQTT